MARWLASSRSMISPTILAIGPPKPWTIEVPKVWNEIKGGYRHQEIKLCKTKRDNGIGIIWRS